ncbi:MAG: cytochrome c, partial [Nitrospira sp. SB0666_bin_27]|nr:cytochrome c [Nitrospira sp. SB0666_bin_27]
NLNPAPRNFRHHGFWRHRTEGEIFWVIKHGSPGTAMIPFGGLLSDKEIWTIIQYERTFSRRSGPPGERGRRHGRGPMMPRSGPGHHRGGNEPCCGEP